MPICPPLKAGKKVGILVEVAQIVLPLPGKRHALGPEKKLVLGCVNLLAEDEDHTT